LENKVLSVFGKIAGLGGLALGVFFLIFRGLLGLQIIPKIGFSQGQAFAIVLAILILTFGVATIGVITWLISRLDPNGRVSNFAVVILSVLFLAVLVAAVYVSTQPIPLDPVKGPDNPPDTRIIPPPPPTPPRPVDGAWDLQMICPDSSALNEAGAVFKQGRYTRTFADGSSSGTTELSLGYISNDVLGLTGYVVFGNSEVYSVEATGKKSGQKLTGKGRFGSTNGCILTGKAK
jgi:hypothetical protein